MESQSLLVFNDKSKRDFSAAGAAKVEREERKKERKKEKKKERKKERKKKEKKKEN